MYLLVYNTIRMRQAKGKPGKRKQPYDPAAMRRYRREYDLLKRGLQALGYVCIGTLMCRRFACGKASCACRRAPSKRHGPYYLWTCKLSGRTRSRLLNESLARLYREGIRNHRRLDEIIDQMRRVSLQAFDAAKARLKSST